MTCSIIFTLSTQNDKKEIANLKMILGAKQVTGELGQGWDNKICLQSLCHIGVYMLLNS